MNGLHMSVDDAAIYTATVDVKTITIGAKQMTLRLFRQLMDEPLIDTRTQEYNGTPWGIVNYHSPDDRCRVYSGEHVHVVWQKDDELRRDTVFGRHNVWRGAELHYVPSPEHASGRYIELLELPQLFIGV